MPQRSPRIDVDVGSLPGQPLIKAGGSGCASVAGCTACPCCPPPAAPLPWMPPAHADVTMSAPQTASIQIARPEEIDPTRRVDITARYPAADHRRQEQHLRNHQLPRVVDRVPRMMMFSFSNGSRFVCASPRTLLNDSWGPAQSSPFGCSSQARAGLLLGGSRPPSLARFIQRPRFSPAPRPGPRWSSAPSNP